MDKKDILDYDLIESKQNSVQIINTDKISLSDIIPVIIHLFFTVYIIYISIYPVDNPTIATISIISTYCLFGAISIFFFFYKSLRKIKVYLIWILISTIHLWSSQTALINNTISESHNINALKHTIIILVYYQICRVVNIKLLGKEFILPVRGSKEQYKASIIDYLYLIILFIYWKTFILSNVT